MHFNLDHRTAAFSVGEFSGFTLGPREAGEGGGAAGIWRAHLGTHWHNQLRDRALHEFGSLAEFELPVTGRIVHRGWTFTLTGRIDQIVRPAGSELLAADDGPRAARPPSAPPALTLREIKSVTRALPADEGELRREYPDYFIQLASYVALTRNGLLVGDDAGARLMAGGAGLGRVQGELVFVETGSGLAQTVGFTPSDDALFRAQLDRVADFLDLRQRARERLRRLRFRSAFPSPRPGQETTLQELTALFEQRPLILFEAPTGFGKTGVLVEFALGQLKSGHFDRVLYLTSKSTGQLQVVRTLQGMTAAAPEDPAGSGTPVAVWHVRNKAEHCVNTTFHCVRDNCGFLAGAVERWPASGLARFYIDEHHRRDLETLRSAGRDARICPYEITRAALAFNDVWIGDYNYVFAPSNRTLFYGQPGFVAARTLLLVDEAHNLPARVADAYSQRFTAGDAYAVKDELHRVRAPAALLTAWDHWCHFLQHLAPTDALPAADEDDAQHLLAQVAQQLSATTMDYAALGAFAADALWSVPAFLEQLKTEDLPRLWWVPRPAELALTCLDAAKAIGRSLREFGGVVLASATLTPVDNFATACGLDDAGHSGNRRTPPLPVATTSEPAAPDRLGTLNKRTTKKLYRQLTTGAALLKVEEARDAASPALLRAHAPWRDGTYRIGFDARVDTTFQHRSRWFATTAATIAALQQRARGPVAVFFPSYAYAEAVRDEAARKPTPAGVAPALAGTLSTPPLRASIQPKARDLNAQAAWVEEALLVGDALFLVLGSSFAEGIDLLGGRVEYAMVVGPALPEVNAVQRARLAEAARRGLSRDAAFRLVYQVPGMTKVNQALGRLVRGPGQRARVLLHCRRFEEETYLALLAPEYREGTTIRTDAELETWLASP